jgi:hypothetical protein
MIIVDNTVKLHLYSMKDFKYLNQIVKRGQGPGEVPYVPHPAINSETITLYSMQKCLFFTREGKYIKEFTTPKARVSYIASIGDRFLVVTHGMDDNKHFEDYSIYFQEPDNELVYETLIYYFSAPLGQIKNNKEPYDLFAGFSEAIICEDKIIISDNTRGLFAEIYDNKGKKISRVKMDIDRVKVPQENIDVFINGLKKYGQWDLFKSRYYENFSEYYPYFYRLLAEKNKLYFLTYNKKEEEREVIVTDWKGNVIKHAYVPWVDYGRTLKYAISNETFYYLVENEDNEEWELHAARIK